MNPKGNIKLVQLKHIGKNVFLNKPFCHIDEDFFTLKNCKEIKEGYLLINRLVANEMTCCILPQMDEKCITAVDVCWIAPDSHYNLKYLMYYLTSSAFQKQVLMKCSGSTRKRISKTNLIKIELNIHSFDIQEKIVKDIENYFNILDKMSNSN